MALEVEKVPSRFEDENQAFIAQDSANHHYQQLRFEKVDTATLRLREAIPSVGNGTSIAALDGSLMDVVEYLIREDYANTVIVKGEVVGSLRTYPEKIDEQDVWGVDEE